MSRSLRARFWFESVAAVGGMILFVLTLFTREWFEVLTGLDPDSGNGALLCWALLPSRCSPYDASTSAQLPLRQTHSCSAAVRAPP